MFFKEILTLVSGICIGFHVMAMGGASLDNWVGKYPNPEFFKDIENDHLKFLPEAIKGQAIDQLTVVIPLEKLQDFLVVQGCRPHQCPFENYAFFIGMTSEKIDYVCTWKKDLDEAESGTMTWYGSTLKRPLKLQKIKAPFGCSFKGEKLHIFLKAVSFKINQGLQEKAILSLVQKGLRGQGE